MRKSYSTGQSLVELLVAMAVASLLLPAILTGLVTTRQGRVQASQRLAATAYLKEALEAVRSVRNQSWQNIATDGSFYPVASASGWSLASGFQNLPGGFTRSIEISDIYRNAGGAIVTNGGTLDPSIKTITATVSWNSLFPSSVTTTEYLARFVSANHVETTVADFTPGILNNTIVTDNFGGEITLGAAAGGPGNDWCSPSASIKTVLDLPGQGVTTAISAIPGHAYTTTGGNASGDALDSLNISDPAAPATPVATLANNYNSNKAYAIYGTPNNVFIGSDHPGLTVIILNPVTLAQVGYFSDSGNERPGQSITVSGNTGYVVAGSKLYAFDVGTINGSSSQVELWNASLAGTGKKVMVVGNYAYVATDSITSQLETVNLTTHAVTSYNIGNNLAGVDLFVDTSGTYVYFVTSYGSGKNNFFILNVTNPMSPTQVSFYSTNGMNPLGLVAVPKNRVVIVGTGGNFYQVIKTDDITKPTYCGGLNSGNFPGVTAINAVAAVQEADGEAFSYILTNNPNLEFQIIQGGPGGTIFANSGSFESATFDASHSVSFNRFVVNALINGPTNINYQIAANDSGSGGCNGATFNFIGPDLTNKTYFATGSAIPYSTGPGYKNPAECFRYRAYLSSSDSAYTPTFTDITVNYSP